MQRPGNLGDLKTDCREFRWERPCAPHKREGVTCPDCPHYTPVADPPAHRVRPARLENTGDTRQEGGVLIVKLAAAGDVLRTTALLPAIRKRYLGARVTWVTQPDAQGLFVGNPLVDEVLTTSEPELMARLAGTEFRAVFCPDADQQTAALAATAGADVRHGFTMDDRGAIQPLNAAAEHWLRMGIWDHLKKANTETYQDLLSKAMDLDPADVGRPILEPTAEDLAWASEFLAGHGLTPPIVGLNTGAGWRWRHKRWTREHQAEFVHQMATAGRAVLLLGGSEEAQTHSELSADRIVSAGTNLGYGQFAAVVGSCQVLVTGDTLALHVATARRVPVVALFGPTSAAEIELYGQGDKIQPIGLPCLVCYLPDCDVQPHCQELISADRVSQAVGRLLR